MATELKSCKGLWFPFSEMPDRYNDIYMVASPKLVDGDANPKGVSTAHWQDDEGWICNGWDMCNDEHMRIVLQDEDITHFMVVEGPYTINWTDTSNPNFGEIQDGN